MLLLKFRLFIFKDPDSGDRGFSLKGIKVPLTTFCPEALPREVKSYDDSDVGGRFPDYWKVPTSLLCMARPDLVRHLRGIDFYYVPTAWCDVAPINSWDQLG